MRIFQLIESMTQYISEAMARIFGPTDDAYPLTGTQPFEGEPFKEKHHADW